MLIPEPISQNKANKSETDSREKVLMVFVSDGGGGGYTADLPKRGEACRMCVLGKNMIVACLQKKARYMARRCRAVSLYNRCGSSSRLLTGGLGWYFCLAIWPRKFNLGYLTV